MKVWLSVSKFLSTPLLNRFLKRLYSLILVGPEPTNCSINSRTALKSWLLVDERKLMDIAADFCRNVEEDERRGVAGVSFVGRGVGETNLCRLSVLGSVKSAWCFILSGETF